MATFGRHRFVSVLALILIGGFLASCQDLDRNKPDGGGSTDSGTGPGMGGGEPTQGTGGLSGTAGASGQGGGGGMVPTGPLMAYGSTSFGGLEVGVPSSVYTWSVKNTGTVPTGVLALTNTNPTELSIATNTCNVAVAAGASCTIGMVFKAAAGGNRSAMLMLSGTPGGSVSLSASAFGQFRVTVSIMGSGGIVTSSPAGITCGNSCSMLVSQGYSLRLQSITSNGQNVFFSGWGGGCTGPGRECTTTILGPTTVTATFSPLTNNLVFITSASVPTNRGNAAAYDVDCNAAATAAGINNAAGNDFIAYLSDATTAAASRIPAAARGWVRMDGKPFADTIASLVPGNQVFNPIVFDEFGRKRGYAITGTLLDGNVGQTCESWTSASETLYASLGNNQGGPGAWGYGASTTRCSDNATRPTYGVICLGKSRSVAVVPSVTPGKKIWVTASGFLPGGAEMPDAKCQADKPAGVTTAVALLATTTKSAGAVLDPASTYVRVDGTVVGTGAQLIARTLTSGIWQSADGVYRTKSAAYQYPYAWTGSANLMNVGSANDTCGNWTDSTLMGMNGDFSDTEYRWWGGFTAGTCTRPLSLYCVQTAP